MPPISKANQRPIIFSGLSPARLALLPDLRRFKNSKVSTVVKQPVTVIESTEEAQQQEEAITSSEPTIELKVSDSLSEPLKSIWLFAKKKGDWVTAKDVYNNGMSVLKGKSVKQIRQYLGLLADSGFGEIDEIDGDKPKSDSSVGFRAS
jgi:CxxC motif-containing protein